VSRRSISFNISAPTGKSAGELEGGAHGGQGARAGSELLVCWHTERAKAAVRGRGASHDSRVDPRPFLMTASTGEAALPTVPLPPPSSPALPPHPHSTLAAPQPHYHTHSTNTTNRQLVASPVRPSPSPTSPSSRPASLSPWSPHLLSPYSLRNMEKTASAAQLNPLTRRKGRRGGATRAVSRMALTDPDHPLRAAQHGGAGRGAAHGGGGGMSVSMSMGSMSFGHRPTTGQRHIAPLSIADAGVGGLGGGLSSSKSGTMSVTELSRILGGHNGGVSSTRHAATLALQVRCGLGCVCVWRGGGSRKGRWWGAGTGEG
jgi:hypothetical protein